MQISLNNRNKCSNLTKSQEHSPLIFRYVINLGKVQKLFNKKKNSNLYDHSHSKYLNSDVINSKMNNLSLGRMMY